MRADKRKFHYIYKITRFDGKYYIGMHSTDDLEDGYFGSGQLLWKSIKKHGKDKHTKEILEFLPSRQELRIRERELVNEEILKDSLCMNLTKGGEGGWSHIDLRGDKNPMRRPEVAKKVSDALKLSITEDERKTRSDRMKIMRAECEVQPHAGHKHSEESKALMSQNRSGILAWNKGLKTGPESEETRKRKSESHKALAKDKDMGALSRGKKFNMRVRVCDRCGFTGTGGAMTRYHFGNCRNSKKS